MLKVLGQTPRRIRRSIVNGAAARLRAGARALGDAWRQVTDLKVKELVDRRYARLNSYGRYTDTKAESKSDKR